MVIFTLMFVACIENSISKLHGDISVDDSEYASSEWDTGDPIEFDTANPDDEDWENNDSDTNIEEAPGQSEFNPRLPHIGDVVLNELMINPDSVHDKNGEWLELLNATDDWVNLEGVRLSDNGVDDIAIEESFPSGLVIPPRGLLVICADDDFWSNGGIDCDGTFLYQTFGGGFGLANEEDEVYLLDDYGHELDIFEYRAGFSEIGVSLGLSSVFTTTEGNDDSDNWCVQSGHLPQGDIGTPGLPNTPCY